MTELSVPVNTAECHTSWVSSLHFHPHGAHLATSSGDGTVKVWEVANGKNVHTYREHTQAVWGCEFHPAGDFVASCSMDHTVRIWDLIAGKCKQTLRGHVDSVNACCWQPCSANVCSASGDKTVSVWDGRTGLCVQTFYGHTNSVNHVKITNRGDLIVSADADGMVKVWDIRMTAELASVKACKSASFKSSVRVYTFLYILQFFSSCLLACVGEEPVNQLCLDRGGHRALVACEDGSVKVLNLNNFTVLRELSAARKAGGVAQCVAAAPDDTCFVTGHADATFRLWKK